MVVPLVKESLSLRVKVSLSTWKVATEPSHHEAKLLASEFIFELFFLPLL